MQQARPPRRPRAGRGARAPARTGADWPKSAQSPQGESTQACLCVSMRGQASAQFEPKLRGLMAPCLALPLELRQRQAEHRPTLQKRALPALV